MLVEFVKFFLKIISAYLFADLLMGIYHWIKDTYFTPFTPLIGKLFIWGSRLHHVRPRYILEFSDWNLFYTSAKWTLIWIIPFVFVFGLDPFLLTLFIVISLNDVVHKYAHLRNKDKPYIAKTFQKLYIIQSHDEHHLHHIEPHTVNYCPITPYVNVVLEKINFWRNIEKFIEKITGISPRSTEPEFIEDPNYPANIKFVINREIVPDNN